MGITVTKENKKDIDRVIHKIVGIDCKNCSATWREVKKLIKEDDALFISKVKEELAVKS